MAARDPVTLSSTRRPLAQIYDVALLDLDGVVYVGRGAVPGAPAALSAVRAMGMRLAFVTNNAARPPAVVAEHLTTLGIPAQTTEVINSAQAAAHYLADRLGAGARVLVVGTVGLDEALAERGLTAVYSADDEPEAVVQGYSPELAWAQLAEGALAIQRGILWVATNGDPTVPSERGQLPGNGSMVAALRYATGRSPVVTGKPDPTMHHESVQRSGAQRPLVVGDRLDTDIEGANAADCPSLLVFSGVTAPAELMSAPPALRPTYVAHDVAGLLEAHAAPTMEADSAACGRWSARWSRERGVLLSVDRDAGEVRRDESSGVATSDALDALRALCAARWSAQESGHPDGTAVSAADADADAALRTLGLSA